MRCMICLAIFTQRHGEYYGEFFDHQLCGDCKFICDLELSKPGIDRISHYVREEIVA